MYYTMDYVPPACLMGGKTEENQSMQLHPMVEVLEKTAVRVRRDLHRIPELALAERKTQAYLLAYLEKLMPDSLERIAGTGVKAVFYAPEAAHTIALRADMDAIGVQESATHHYASQHQGRMHACGHDGHMTMLLLLAELVAPRRDTLRCNVVLLFQPAEEGYGGAKLMVEQGALETPRVDRIYGLHLWPDVPAGKLGIRWGPMMAKTMEFDLVVEGVSAHGASPQMGVDAIVAAAELISMLQSVLTRGIDPHEDALLTIGRIEGGTARNVIADRVEMNATLRTFTDRVFERITEKLLQTLKGVEMATGAKARFLEHMRYPCVDNPRYLVEDFYTYFDKEDLTLVEPVMAAEDFSYYQQQVPGLYAFLGTGQPGHEAPLHANNFSFDERVLLYGVEVYRRLLCLE